jgi:hypothetical protein
MVYSLLGGKGGRLQALTRGPGSHPAPRGREKLVFLCHATCMTLSRKWLAGPHLGRDVLEPPSLYNSGLVFLRPRLGCRRKSGMS